MCKMQYGTHQTALWHESGTMRWLSCSMYDGGELADANFKAVPVVNARYALAVVFSPVSKKHAEDFLGLMALQPPSRPKLDQLIDQGGIRTYAMEEKVRVEEQQMAKVKEGGQSIMVAIDTGHNSCRHSQAATALAAVGITPLTSLTDTENPAPLKEGKLMDRLLHKLINVCELDVGAVIIDENASNAKKISGYRQMHSSNPALVTSPVGVKHDTFHVGGNMAKRAVKYSSKCLTSLLPALKKRCRQRNSLPDVLAFLASIEAEITRGADAFFTPLKCIFAGGAVAHGWDAIRHSPEQVKAFAIEHKLVDVAPSGDWSVAIAAWNTHAKEPDKISSIEQLQFSYIAAANLPVVKAVAKAISERRSEGPEVLAALARKDTLWEDVEAATQIALGLFNTRAGDLKRQMKRLFLTCDQTFGCFSLSFKVFFVTNGLMNFADHYCNKHDNCNRFIWWGLKQPRPSLQLIDSPDFPIIGSGVYIQQLHGGSSLAERLNATTVNESYFHSMAIMNPKWANIPARQYQLGEAANFIMFTNRQRDRQKFQKVLSFNKNAPGL
ncbi:hypothetical protein B484DRAFT_483756, partial [Ochromonadaceae sp. CCMP2298]